MFFFAELLAIGLTLIALALIFLLWTNKPLGRQFENIPLYFFLILSLLLLWKEKMPGDIPLSSFAWLFNRFSFVSGSVATRSLALVILGAIYFFLRKEYRKSFTVDELARNFRHKGPWFAMFVILFFTLGSFLFIDYTRIADMWVLPAQNSTEEVIHAGEGGFLGTSVPSPAGVPRGRTLKSIGEFSARIVFPLTAGIIGVVALVFTWLRTNAIMEQTRNTTKTLENTRKTLENAQKQITSEQFKNAIDHLGNARQAIVLGGIHALHDLAMNNVEYRQRVLEILCSFIREETNKANYQRRVLEILAKEENANQSLEYGETPRKPAAIDHFYASLNSDASDGFATSMIVVQTIIDKLFRTESSRKVYQEYDADLSGAFLRGVNFSRAHLTKVKLFKAKLQGVRFNGANLQETNFEGADLRSADLQANLQKTIFRRANLQKAKMHRANLQKADLEGAMMQHVEMQRANLRGANLREARLEHADLQQTDFWSANLLRANLQWANLQEANFQEADLRSAVLRGCRLIAANLCGASLEGAWMWGALLHLAELDEETVLMVSQLQGSQSVDEIYYNTLIKEAIRNKAYLKTELSSVRIVAKNGVEIRMTPDEKWSWFLRKRANVGDLPPEKVLKLAQGLGLE